MQMSVAAKPLATRRGRIGAAIWRVRQFGHAIRSHPDPTVDAELQRLLASEAYWRLLARLTAFDRAHHLRVYRLLIEAGQDDPDLLLAGLLHDAGKADERGRVSAVHRAAHVVLGLLVPGLLARLAHDGGWLRHGLWLSVHHAEIGAKLVHAAGGSERCCALIRQHDDPCPADPLVAALVAADNAAIR